jgi:hypothetical protein
MDSGRILVEIGVPHIITFTLLIGTAFLLPLDTVGRMMNEGVFVVLYVVVWSISSIVWWVALSQWRHKWKYQWSRFVTERKRQNDWGWL